MTGDDDGGRRQVGGIPVGGRGRGRRPIVGETEPRFLGMPARWVRPSVAIEARAARHPIRWLHWRVEVRRLGPYARPFDGRPHAPRPSRGDDA